MITEIVKARGHKNILGKHKTTFEITKETHLTLRGDCIIGVNAELGDGLIRFAREHSCFRMVVCAGDKELTVHGKTNKGFNDTQEMVVRKTGFQSIRTFGILADKAAIDIPREIVADLKKGKEIEVFIE